MADECDRNRDVWQLAISRQSQPRIQACQACHARWFIGPCIDPLLANNTYMKYIVHIHNSQALNRAMPWRVVLSHFGLFTVGLGSAAFHGTLLYEAQLMDELPMVSASKRLIT
jgi:hypothetical protein